MPAAGMFDLIVEVAFGYNSLASVPDPSGWTDISNDVIVNGSGSSLVATLGREVGAGITPGTLSFTLDNRGDKYNPRNTAGPYYGQLLNGVPIRIRASRSIYPVSNYVLWTGFVSEGWPQTASRYSPTVTVTGHDILGLLAQGDPPDDALEAWGRSVASPPKWWWRPTNDGWIDTKLGKRGSHTGGLTEMDSLISSDVRTWGQDDPDGHAVITDTSAFPDLETSNFKVVSFWVRTVPLADRVVDPEDPTGKAGVVLLDISNLMPDLDTDTVGFIQQWGGLKIIADAVENGRFEVYLHTSTAGAYFTNSVGTTTGSVRLTDGAPHHVAIKFRKSTDDLVILIDGQRVTLQRFTTLFGGPFTYNGMWRMSIGDATAVPFRGSSWDTNTAPYQGAIDHVMVWDNYGGSDGDFLSMAGDIFAAGQLGWSGQTLSTRLTNIVQSMGASNYVGGIYSSITTFQSYRGGDFITLLQQIEDSEQGYIWVGRNGRLNMSDRSWHVAPTDTASLLSDDASLITAGTHGELIEAGTVITDNVADITNVATVTTTWGRAQTMESASSITTYGRRNPIHLSGLLFPSDGMARDVAAWIILSRAQPKLKVKQVAFDVDAHDPWSAAGIHQLRLAIGQQTNKVTIVKQIAGAPNQTITAHIMGIRHEFSFTGWRGTANLDNTRTGFNFFTWGTSKWGDTQSWGF